MILAELKGIKTGHVNDTYSDFILNLAQKHGIALKTGMQAKVLVMPGKDYVYRIWVDDDGYEQWLEYCNSHTSKHLPKILSPVRVLDVTFSRLPKDLKIKLVKLEKLEPLTDVELIHAIEMLNELKFRISFAKLDALSFEGLQSLLLNENPGASHGVEFMKPTTGTAEVLLEYKSFFELCLSLSKIANDLIPDNVMMRGNIPVLADPISA